jgi:preprotein translocase subunit SecE
MWKRHIFSAFSILLSFCGLSFLFVLFLVFNYVQDKNQNVQIAKHDAQQEIIKVTKQIDSVMSDISSIAHAIADDISSGKLKRQQILLRLKNTLENTPNIFGVGVAFVPYVNHSQKRKLSPYYVNRITPKGAPKQDFLEVFSIPITYFDVAKQYKVIIGVVFIDYLLSNVRTLTSSLQLGRSGYGFILSEKGVFIVHPIDDYVENRQTVFHLAESYNDDALRRLAEKAVDGESGVIDHIDQVTGQSAWIFYQFIPSTHWSMGAVFFKSVSESTSLRQQLIKICIVIIIFVILLSALIFRVDLGERRSLWNTVIFSSLLLIAGIGFLWYLAQTAPFPQEAGSTMIVEKVGLQKFISSHAKQTSKKQLFYVPTGVFIESIKFSDVNNVTFSGYIWQKYTDNHKDISRGFVLSGAESSKITEVYHLKEDQIEVIGWHFQATVRHQFSYAKYPFDKRHLSLQISHKDFNKKVILTPDLEAYRIMNPSVRPGLKREVALSGWLILKSFFNYRTHYENTNFGINDYMRDTNFPHFYVNVLLKREFFGQFIGNVLPLIIVSTILFALQMWLGKTTTFIRSLIGLFFGILLAHIRLRGTITTPEIIYLEFFYLIIYCSYLITTFSFFLFRYKIGIGYYRDGLVPKLLFWPFILVSSFVITVIVFYD